MKLSNTDYIAIENKDSEYFLFKARLYKNNEEYDEALMYYNLASTLGDISATTELGEYYLNVEKNVSLALAYFKISSLQDDIEALYNLGKLYNDGKFVEEDKELGHYYYSRALDIVNELDDEERVKYPSLHLDVAKDIIEHNETLDSLVQAYDYLEVASDGFMFLLSNGLQESADKLKETEELLDSDIFEEVREILKSEEDDGCHCGHCHE